MSTLTPQPVPVRRKGFEPDGSEQWYVLLGDEQCGPFPAAEMAKRLDSGAIEWSTAVWRQGFREWRPARRDSVLVTSVAGERGFGSDTLRLHSAASFVVPEDTVVDHAPPQHDTVKLDRPPDFDPDDLSSEPPPPPARAATAETDAAPDEGGGRPTYSSSTLLRVGPWTVRVPHSVISVAAVSFAAGVLAAALWARFLGRPEPIEVLVLPGAEQQTAGPGQRPEGPTVASPQQAEAPEVGSEPDEPAPAPEAQAPGAFEGAPQVDPSQVTLEPSLPSRALPKSSEIRDALREVAPGVHRCLANPTRGVELLLYLDGPSGRVRDVRIRRPRLGPVQARCVVHAVRGLQIEPFRRQELAYPYRFAW